MDGDSGGGHAPASAFVENLLRRAVLRVPPEAIRSAFEAWPFAVHALRVVFMGARVYPTTNPKSFEDWIVNQFGRRLFEIFFKTYTEKVWGTSCQKISADWAAQRIKGLSLGSAIKNAVMPKRRMTDQNQVVKTLIDTFRYPRLGPGMMWETCARRVRGMGGELLLGRSVDRCRLESETGHWTVTAHTPDGRVEEYRAEHVISSMPMRQLVEGSSHRSRKLRYAPRKSCDIGIS